MIWRRVWTEEITRQPESGSLARFFGSSWARVDFSSVAYSRREIKRIAARK
jgi:hypothetical protein